MRTYNNENNRVSQIPHVPVPLPGAQRILKLTAPTRVSRVLATLARPTTHSFHQVRYGTYPVRQYICCPPEFALFPQICPSLLPTEGWLGVAARGRTEPQNHKTTELRATHHHCNPHSETGMRHQPASSSAFYLRPTANHCWLGTLIPLLSQDQPLFKSGSRPQPNW